MFALEVSQAVRAVYIFDQQNWELVKLDSISFDSEEETWQQKLVQVECLWRFRLLQRCLDSRNAIQRRQKSEEQKLEIVEYKKFLLSAEASDDSDGLWTDTESDDTDA